MQHKKPPRGEVCKAARRRDTPWKKGAAEAAPHVKVRTTTPCPRSCRAIRTCRRAPGSAESRPPVARQTSR